MPEQKHTPGPWEANGNGIHKGMRCIALTQYSRRVEGEFEIACANALLIAAAPELLEACNAALDFVSDIISETAEPDLFETADVRDKLRAAIDKASL